MITIKFSKDAKLLAKLNEAVQNWHHSNFPNEFKAYNFLETEMFFKKVLEKEEVYSLVAFKKDIAIGYVFFYIVRKEENAFQTKRVFIHIDQLSVAEKYQNKGIGKMLLCEVEKISKEKNIHSIKLDFWRLNEKAKHFFNQNNFNVFNFKMIKILK